jgi:hypothetical protein
MDFNKPWSVVTDEELKLMRDLVIECKKLRRGCDCGYDRCGMCQTVINVLELTDKIST